MKLASYRDGSRDGQLVVVARDLKTACYATGVAQRLQQVLDDWNFMAPQLQRVYEQLNAGVAAHAFAFEPQRCLAPLPRAHERLEAQAWPAHDALLAQARGAAGHEVQTKAAAAPGLWHGSGTAWDGPCSTPAFDPGWQVDAQAGLAAIGGALPAAATPEQGQDAVRLLMLVAHWSLQGLDGTGGVSDRVASCPLTACSPVAVTPDELGPAWQDGRVHLSLQLANSSRRIGVCQTGAGMAHDFGTLLAHAARTRALGPGTVLCAGVVADAEAPRQGRPQWPRGCASLQQKRALEQLLEGQAHTPYLQAGDRLRLDMKGRDGLSVFGALELGLATDQGAV